MPGAAPGPAAPMCVRRCSSTDFHTLLQLLSPMGSQPRRSPAACCSAKRHGHERPGAPPHRRHAAVCDPGRGARPAGTPAAALPGGRPHAAAALCGDPLRAAGPGSQPAQPCGDPTRPRQPLEHRPGPLCLDPGAPCGVPEGAGAGVHGVAVCGGAGPRPVAVLALRGGLLPAVAGRLALRGQRAEQQPSLSAEPSCRRCARYSSHCSLASRAAVASPAAGRTLLR